MFKRITCFLGAFAIALPAVMAANDMSTITVGAIILVFFFGLFMAFGGPAKEAFNHITGRDEEEAEEEPPAQAVEEPPVSPPVHHASPAHHPAPASPPERESTALNNFIKGKIDSIKHISEKPRTLDKAMILGRKVNEELAITYESKTEFEELLDRDGKRVFMELFDEAMKKMKAMAKNYADREDHEKKLEDIKQKFKSKVLPLVKKKKPSELLTQKQAFAVKESAVKAELDGLKATFHSFSQEACRLFEQCKNSFSTKDLHDVIQNFKTLKIKVFKKRELDAEKSIKDLEDEVNDLITHWKSI